MTDEGNGNHRYRSAPKLCEFNWCWTIDELTSRLRQSDYDDEQGDDDELKHQTCVHLQEYFIRKQKEIECCV